MKLTKAQEKELRQERGFLESMMIAGIWSDELEQRRKNMVNKLYFNK